MVNVPFHLVVPGHVDCLGIIRISTSRRVKNTAKVHINTGADYEHVMDLDCLDTWETHPEYYVAKWLEDYGYTEEYFGLETLNLPKDPTDFDTKEFEKLLKRSRAKIRIW